MQRVAAPKNDNLLWRLHAQRLLVERGARDSIPALVNLTADQGVDEIGLNTAAIHALWTRRGLGALDGSDPKATAAAAARNDAGFIKAVLAGYKPAAATSATKSPANLIHALGENRQPNTGAALTAHWPELTPTVRRAAIVVLMRRGDWALALLDAVANEKLNKRR